MNIDQIIKELNVNIDQEEYKHLNPLIEYFLEKKEIQLIFYQTKKNLDYVILYLTENDSNLIPYIQNIYNLYGKGRISNLTFEMYDNLIELKKEFLKEYEDFLNLYYLIEMFAFLESSIKLFVRDPKISKNNKVIQSGNIIISFENPFYYTYNLPFLKYFVNEVKNYIITNYKCEKVNQYIYFDTLYKKSDIYDDQFYQRTGFVANALKSLNYHYSYSTNF